MLDFYNWESEVIVYAFLLAGIITFWGIVFFVILNRRDSNLDNKAYDDTFDPSSMVKKYRYQQSDPDDDIDPVHALKRFAQPTEPSNKGMPSKSKAPAPKSKAPKSKKADPEIEIDIEPPIQQKPAQKVQADKVKAVKVESKPKIEEDTKKYAPPKKTTSKKNP